QPADASADGAVAEDSPSLLPQLSSRQAAVLGVSAGVALLLALVAAVSCTLTRRWLRGRRRRAEEHLARVRLGKQISPPATCLRRAHTVSVCLSQLGSPPRCGSIDGSGSGSGPCAAAAASAAGVGGCSGSDRQSTSTSTFLMGGSAASRAGSLPSPRESLATYSLQQHHCATSISPSSGTSEFRAQSTSELLTHRAGPRPYGSTAAGLGSAYPHSPCRVRSRPPDRPGSGREVEVLATADAGCGSRSDLSM
uniref:Neuropilin-2 n=1 Tax=Macrostomum lignano TaxID=282301 RepID=A0A1I8FR90_9PLAT